MRNSAIAALLAVSALPAAAATLSLEEVLRSAQASYPLLLATIQDRAMAEGKTLSAEGAFDTKLSAKSESNQFGYYRNRVNGAAISQPLRDWGAEAFGGYKRGQGNFGPWEQDLLTLSRGEWSAGVTLPLFRDRQTDEQRTELLLARLSIELADASIEKQRLKLLESASKSYWDWVSAGHKLGITEDLLGIAVERNGQIQELADAGQIAAIEVLDNQRAMLERQAAVVSAKRDLRAAQLELSLFYRDDAGQPRVVGRELLPDFPEPEMISAVSRGEDLTRALARRPEITGTLVEVRQTDAELRLARNRLLPDVDVTARYGRDAGTGSITKRGDEFVAEISINTPFQRRKAKGEAAVQQAKLTQLDQELRYARNRIQVELNSSLAMLDAALERLDLARAELGLADSLADAERERFELGDSTLFIVNLRELSVAGSRLKVVAALADCHKSIAVYRTVTTNW